MFDVNTVSSFERVAMWREHFIAQIGLVSDMFSIIEDALCAYVRVFVRACVGMRVCVCACGSCVHVRISPPDTRTHGCRTKSTK